MASDHVHPPLGIIGGSSFLEGLAPLSSDVELELREVDTNRGAVMVREGAGMVCLLRHGEDRYYPPHRIRHHAHVLAMEKLGVEHVVAFASTGSLDPDIAPGDVVVPDDYLSRHPPPTFCEDEPLHIVPELDAGLRGFLLETARHAAEADPATVGGDIRETGVYGETRGPRFETRAEVRALARDADLVGMTAASEATLFQERGLKYAVLCIVDNWAHGVGPDPLSLEAFRKRQAANRELALTLFRAVVGAWRQADPSPPPLTTPPEPEPI